MWHLKTKLGIFWVVEASKDTSSAQRKSYYLGIDDQELGVYDDIAKAAKDVHQQATGYFSWDCQSKVQAPAVIGDWKQGQPEDW